MSETVNPAMFRAYDIRGLVDVDLTDTNLLLLGRVAGQLFREHHGQRVVVGRDARLSSPRFQAAFMDGLCQSGIDVIDIGEVPTPVMYFALEHVQADGGAVISASHNPPEYNGVKLRWAEPQYGSQPFSTADIQEIGRRALESDALPVHHTEQRGTLTQFDVRDAYVDYVTSLLPLTTSQSGVWLRSGGRRPRVVLDGGNGVAGPMGMRVLEAVGAEVIPLYIEPDGRFPNHHPDPLKPENLRDLITMVQEHGADMGIALDGDGDRLGVVDDTGAMIWADRYLIVLGHALIQHYRGVQTRPTIVFDVKCSNVLVNAIHELGGTPVMWRTGYPSISAKMRETSAVLGGELSGHTIFTYPKHYYDDGVFAGVHLLHALCHGLQAHDPTFSLSRALEPYPILPSMNEDRLRFTDTTKFQAVEYVRQRFAGRYPIIAVDGVRVDFGDGWGVIRASNTEPVITTRFEAVTEERLAAIRDLMLETVADFRERLHHSPDG